MTFGLRSVGASARSFGCGLPRQYCKIAAVPVAKLGSNYLLLVGDDMLVLE